MRAIETRAQTDGDKRAWTSGELAVLRKLGPDGAAAVAEALGRSVRSVQRQAARQGVSLRRRGERRGSVIGERVPGALPSDLRRLALDGISDAERALRRVLLDLSGELCPSCTYRPAEVASTGLCNVCHDRRLAAAHRQEVVTVSARRELVTARQQKHRARQTR